MKGKEGCNINNYTRVILNKTKCKGVILWEFKVGGALFSEIRKDEEGKHGNSKYREQHEPNSGWGVASIWMASGIKIYTGEKIWNAS